jgi:hypothetical protein
MIELDQLSFHDRTAGGVFRASSISRARLKSRPACVVLELGVGGREADKGPTTLANGSAAASPQTIEVIKLHIG